MVANVEGIGCHGMILYQPQKNYFYFRRVYIYVFVYITGDNTSNKPMALYEMIPHILAELEYWILWDSRGAFFSNMGLYEIWAWMSNYT